REGQEPLDGFTRRPEQLGALEQGLGVSVGLLRGLRTRYGLDRHRGRPPWCRRACVRMDALKRILEHTDRQAQGGSGIGREGVVLHSYPPRGQGLALSAHERAEVLVSTGATCARRQAMWLNQRPPRCGARVMTERSGETVTQRVEGGGEAPAR